MNTKQYMIIAKGKIITPYVVRCQYNEATRKQEITFKNGQTYSYNFDNVVWLREPQVLNPSLYQISRGDNELFDIAGIYVFNDTYHQYWYICFENGSERDYERNTIQVVKSCLDDSISKDTFEYLKRTADLVSLKSDDGTKLLSMQYTSLCFVGEDRTVANYLNPQKYKSRHFADSTPIFPFGCNASQFKAVKEALENQISVIEGPPGTGKTQTILNIIANLLIAGKTVQVVSNNNSATANILEKLASPKYGMDFLIAPLGNSDNKEKFIKNQRGKYPDISDWNDEATNNIDFFEAIRNSSTELNAIFTKQERLALAKQELQELNVELEHFKQYASETNNDESNIKIRRKLKSSKIMELWQECQNISDTEKNISFFFKLKSCLLYGISDWKFYNNDITKIIAVMQRMFYDARHRELVSEIDYLEKELKISRSTEKADQFAELSIKHLKASLYRKYGNRKSRRIFTEEDLWKNHKDIQAEYPIVLSTTFSSRSSLCKDAEFDYLIMDEASQVDVATGALALSSTKNAVIVGDSKQLPNVVSENVEKCSQAIFNSFKVSESYNYAHKSFLQSVCEVMPEIPRTLLREHYRCRPKIINFCNQKFYNGQLVIMTNENGEKDTLSVVKTVVGDHTRGHLNRRQIDVVTEEILPKLTYEPKEIGVIAPYNAQVNAMRKAINNSDIDVATVHKFQGREKDTIVLTTVDDEITDFTDDPYLLNVAVSRAKNQFCLVVSGDEQQKDSNIGDLISYIEYNNFSVTESEIYSVFDYLYRQYTESRFKFLKKHKQIFEYDSENLMYALITDTLQEVGLYNLGVLCHQPLNMLIRNPHLLNDDECKYAMNSATHLDFLIYNRTSKKPVLAIEVDGFNFHKEGTKQAERDKMKNHILELYDIPYLRFATNGSGEKEKLTQKLNELISK